MIRTSTFPTALLSKFTLATLLGLFIVSLAPSEAAAKQNNRANWPKSFTIQYCWGATDPAQIDEFCPEADSTLHRRPKTFDVFDNLTGNFVMDAGTWKKTRRWETIEFELSNGVIYSGYKLPNGEYEGTIWSPSGIHGVWRGRFN